MIDLRNYFPESAGFVIRQLGEVVGRGFLRKLERDKVSIADAALKITDPRFPYDGPFEIGMAPLPGGKWGVGVRLKGGRTETDYDAKLKVVGSQLVISAQLFNRHMGCTLERPHAWSNGKIEYPGVKVEFTIEPSKTEADLPADLTFDPATMPSDMDFFFKQEVAG